MDLATALSLLNNPKHSWDTLQHITPALLDAVRHKNIKMVAAFLNHKIWGEHFYSLELTNTMFAQHWPEGWDVLVQKALGHDKLLGMALTSSRPNFKLFETIIEQFWNAYSVAPAPRTKKHQKFVSGVHQIMLTAVQFNDYDLYVLCKNKIALTSQTDNRQWSFGLAEQAGKYMCFWAIDDVIRFSGQGLYNFSSFLRNHSFAIDEQKLLQLCTTLWDVSKTQNFNAQDIVNLIFKEGMAYSPIFNEFCKEIDQRPTKNSTVYSKDVFETAYTAHFDGSMNYDDAIYWINRVWQQRIDTPSLGAGELEGMLVKLLNASAVSNQWELVVHLSEQFSDTYEILIRDIVKWTRIELSTAENIVHNINDCTNAAVLESTYTSPTICALREKIRLEHEIGAVSPVKRGKKL